MRVQNPLACASGWFDLLFKVFLMCMFSVVYQQIPDCPVLILANREESQTRPSTNPEITATTNSLGDWLGGKDKIAGGTWLGINRAGVIVAVTNRAKMDQPATPKSRGLLCRELLEQGTWEAAQEEFQRQYHPDRFAGFNLMLISEDNSLVYSAGDELVTQSMKPGCHAITNRDWNDPTDQRIHRVRHLLEITFQENPRLEDWITRSKHLCGLGENTGGDAVCIPCQNGWGTVSSSILALTLDRKLSRYHHAAGSPSSTAFADYSPKLTALLKDTTP